MKTDTVNKETLQFISDVEQLRRNGVFKRDSELVTMLDWDKSNMSLVLNKHRNVPKEKLQKFANLFSNSLHNPAEANNKTVTLYDNIVATGGKMESLNNNEGKSKIQLGDVFKDATGAMWVHGHSMYPDYENGCMVGFREIKDHSIIAYNEVYIIVTDEMCLIKRINKCKDNPKCVIASSINEKFEPFEIPRDKIRSLFLVLGKISRAQMSNLNF